MMRKLIKLCIVFLVVVAMAGTLVFWDEMVEVDHVPTELVTV